MSAQLFDPDHVQDIQQEIANSPVQQGQFQNSLVAVSKLTTQVLQRFVRTQFLSIPRDKWTVPFQEFCCSTVIPSLEIHVPSWNAKVVRGAKEMANKIRSRNLSDLSELNLRMACQVASGCLNEHPLVQGILVAALELAHRKRHGATTMKNLQVSDLELSIMSEAGCMISLAANNMHLLRAFGLAFTVPRLPLANLQGVGLPEPFLAISCPTMLQSNARLIESILALPDQKAIWIIWVETLAPTWVTTWLDQKPMLSIMLYDVLVIQFCMIMVPQGHRFGR